MMVRRKAVNPKKEKHIGNGCTKTKEDVVRTIGTPIPFMYPDDDVSMIARLIFPQCEEIKGIVKRLGISVDDRGMMMEFISGVVGHLHDVEFDYGYDMPCYVEETYCRTIEYHRVDPPSELLRGGPVSHLEVSCMVAGALENKGIDVMVVLPDCIGFPFLVVRCAGGSMPVSFRIGDGTIGVDFDMELGPLEELARSSQIVDIAELRRKGVRPLDIGVQSDCPSEQYGGENE